ncbi:MAG: Asp-tRNA(Asn)/Glu-tRNA(Gln) amidotransferase GatCAB subunit A [Candidatus Methanomethylicota archaeon]|uniref:Glutamyl-tRNA(Gln) amidotransferase subunit A n=1 Tax=Thermoproteota archaeon TaxID=2056631 RepID=A0A497ESY8_9CREN|nr:MAG: Asp-tRNA(Asn)/Glu-tRNA(Gln) amidotransferase GatCAB subunit A [Candidatus Verstraetearchaeota archaeon]RLE53785.1 MAG: Asp-tRNA(Asn)/Glu-tRNA(Gln) amidotransferase GatCAB subunit A [Candidatus Verstraetearchaeota archaeon]
MNILDLTLSELIDKLAREELELEKVLEEYSFRIRSVEDKLNSYVTVLDPPLTYIRSPQQVLKGSPIAIKDNICTKGVKTTCSSKILENYIPPYNATVIEKLAEAGFTLIGKTNMDEFAMGSSTETSAFGPTRNPWNLNKVPGGSSGGSAAAVAAREAVAALGSDTGGSIRCPAAFCGVVGLKPTYGLVSRYGLIAYANSLEQIGPITRDVKDAALLLDIIAGRDERDSTSIDKPISSYLNTLVADVKGIKIGVPKEMFGEGIDSRVADIVWSAIKLLETHGAEYHEISLPSLSYALPAYYIIAMSEASSNLARYDGVRYGFSAFENGMDWATSFSKTRGKGFGMEVKRRIILGTFALSAGFYEEYYLKALKVRTLIKQDFDKAFKNYHVLISPTMPTPAFNIGEKILDPLSMYMMDVETVPVNLAGIPALSVPCGFVNGLPVGMQIMAPALREDIMLKVGYAFETLSKLRNLKPPV